MGLEGVLLDGQDNHAAEFTCAICCSLVDAPLLTRCQHIFCLACLQDWLATKPSCPTCSLELDPRHGAGELRLASPLAWRVLGRLRVKCPLQGCTWHGEYTGLSDHMTSSDTHQAGAAGSATEDGGASPRQQSAARLQQAEQLKAAGNSKFEQRIYRDAFALYSKAINLAPEVPTYRLNRAATSFMTADYDSCIDDCADALRLDPALVKAHKRLAKALIERGELEKAAAALDAGVAACGGEVLAEEVRTATQLCEWQREGELALEQGNATLARTFFANALQKTSAVRCRLSLVRAELALGLCDRALRTTREVIKQDANASEAYVLRALALFYSADLDQAHKHLKAALRLDPDDAEAGRTMKKVRKLERHVDAAKQAAFSRNFEDAAREYTQALETASAPQHAPLSASLYADRAATWLRLKDFDATLKDCAVAIYAQDDCTRAFVTRASALHHLGRHNEALQMLEGLMQTFGQDTQVSAAYKRAQFEVRKERRPDYYALLAVPSVASTLEIKAGYKQRALECHPDKNCETEEARAAAEAQFKLLGEALEVLSDDVKRKLYNEGYDKAAIEERVQAANRAASNHDKDGCCRGGGCS